MYLPNGYSRRKHKDPPKERDQPPVANRTLTGATGCGLMDDMAAAPTHGKANKHLKYKPRQGPGQNPAGPPIFAQSTKLNNLLVKFPTVSLSHVMAAAGLPSPTALKTDSLPDDACLLWICFGHCASSSC